MTKSRSFKDLLVWQKSMKLVKEIYAITRSFPKNEEYALTVQLRRCAVSIPSNIAEGSRRGTQKDFIQFLRIADGSAAELETQLILAKDLYPAPNYQKSAGLLDEVQKMLAALLIKLKT